MYSPKYHLYWLLIMQLDLQLQTIIKNVYRIQNCASRDLSCHSVSLRIQLILPTGANFISLAMINIVSIHYATKSMVRYVISENMLCQVLYVVFIWRYIRLLSKVREVVKPIVIQGRETMGILHVQCLAYLFVQNEGWICKEICRSWKQVYHSRP